MNFQAEFIGVSPSRVGAVVGELTRLRWLHRAAGMRKAHLLGWLLFLAGLVVWLYGYLRVSGHAPIVDWAAVSPWWIAAWLPNLEAEIGMGLMCASMVPFGWLLVPPSSETEKTAPVAQVDASPATTYDAGAVAQESSRLESPQPQAGQPVVNVMELVRGMVWTDPEVRRAYEALRSRGLSGDDALTEIANAYVACQWDAANQMPNRWPHMLRERFGESRTSLQSAMFDFEQNRW